MDLNKLMQQAQAMQKKLGDAQAELEASIYEGNTGGSEGVTVKINGKNEVQEVLIGEDLMGADNREMLQDMILIAVNDAVDKAAADREDKMGSATAGLKIPGM